MLNFRKKTVARHLRKDSSNYNTAIQLFRKFLFLNFTQTIQNIEANVNTRSEFSNSCFYFLTFFFKNACSKKSLED